MTIDSSYPTAWAKSVAEADAENIYQQTYGRDRRTAAEKMRGEANIAENQLRPTREHWQAASPNRYDEGNKRMQHREYIDNQAFVRHIEEANKRLKATVDAVPMGTGPVQGAIGSHAQRGADDKQVSGSHYKDMPIQPWAVMESILTRAEFVGFLKGNIIKYSLRAGRKEGSDDAGKARHYMEKLLEVNR
jgi:hypothetical protein